MIKYFTKGIQWSNPNLTREMHIWWQYFAWCLHMKMRLNLIWPLWFRVWWYKRFRFAILCVPILNRIWRKTSAILAAQTGGRSHRCEFTDKQQGALYGGKDGGFMNKYFEQLLRNIDKTTEDGENADGGRRNGE
jgi:hypothetical protein